MKKALSIYKNTLDEIKANGLYKNERVIIGPQGSKIRTDASDNIINMCANNYLGLASDTRLVQASKDALDKYGYGMASVRFICGTQQLHKELEGAVSKFLGTDDTILYSSCFDANGGLFETILTNEDAILSDQLNHASIIDGVRLCKAARYSYLNNDMDDLRAKLVEATEKGARIKLIVTDGVFSMDGYIANLPAICDLADEFDALVVVDDSHAVGFWGPTGRGTPEYWNVSDRVDIITGTFGKALGGALGGYTSGRREIIDLLRQRSRPYLFSNSLPPSIMASTLETFRILTTDNGPRETLMENTRYFRDSISKLGLDVLPGEHPITPVMLYDAHVSAEFAAKALEKGVYVVSFSFPVVPNAKARIRMQVSAAHTRTQLDYVLSVFEDIKKDMRI